MTTLSPRPLLPDFLPSFNSLLNNLALPFIINDPTDLTPSLLLAVFESLISARLPIPNSIRQSRTRDAKTRAMLVLLGVLECDILRGGTDAHPDQSIATSAVDDSMLAGAGGVSVNGWVDEIGLGDVDPERLADGGWEETIFIGELLCWLARRKGILPRSKSSRRTPRSLYSNYHSYGDGGESADFSTSLLLRPLHTQNPPSPRPLSPSRSIHDVDLDISALSHVTDVPRHPLVHSPEPSFSASATTGTDLSIRVRSVSSRTSVSNPNDELDQLEEASQDTVQMFDLRRRIPDDDEDDDDRPPTFRPRCIHELEDPSYIRALASSDPSASHDHVSQDYEDDLSEREDELGHDDLYAPPTPTPRRVRVTGWIDPVDAAEELDHFAASRSQTRPRSSVVLSSSQKSTRASTPRDSASHRKAEASSRPHSGVGTSRSSRRVSSSPPPSPSPSPSPSPHGASSKNLSGRAPSPPPLHSDSPFDVSFSTLNNTSTPAKPRSSRRTERLTVNERSSSYTSSPPFSMPAVRGSQTASGTSLKPKSSTVGKQTSARASSPPPRTREFASTSPVPRPGSTAMTSTLLTERARLLTELAALKRARTMSSGGGLGSGTEAVATRTSGHRVGVGI